MLTDLNQSNTFMRVGLVAWMNRHAVSYFKDKCKTVPDMSVKAGCWLSVDLASVLPEALEEERTTWPTAACLSVPLPTRYSCQVQKNNCKFPLSVFHALLIYPIVCFTWFIALSSIFPFDQMDVGAQLWYLAHFRITLHVSAQYLLWLCLKANQLYPKGKTEL